MDMANQMTHQIAVRLFSSLNQRQHHQVHQRQCQLLSRQDQIVAKTTNTHYILFVCLFCFDLDDDDDVSEFIELNGQSIILNNHRHYENGTNILLNSNFIERAIMNYWILRRMISDNARLHLHYINIPNLIETKTETETETETN